MEGFRWLDWSIPAFDAMFWTRVWAIILINLILSNDTAVIIAMAVNKLPPARKRWGIILGSGLVVVYRIIITGFALFLIKVPFLKLASGILILCIAVKLFADGHKDNYKALPSLIAAILIILIADLAMNIQNVLAVAGAADGGMILISIGLVVSIPLIVLKSWFLSFLMIRFPIIFTIGAAILGLVGGKMIISDKSVIALFHEGGPLANLNWGEVDETIINTIQGVKTEIVKQELNGLIALLFKILCSVGVIVVGKLLIKKGQKPKDAGAPLAIKPE